MFRIIIFICCFGESLILVIAYSINVSSLDRKTPEEGDVDQEKLQKQSQDYQKWIEEKFSEEKKDIYGSIISPSQQWSNYRTVKTSEISHFYYSFMCTDLFFDSLVIVYWLGFLYCNWFDGADGGSGGSRERVPSKQRSNSSSGSGKKGKKEVEEV